MFPVSSKKFPSLRKNKIKEGLFVGLDIRKLMKNDNLKIMTDLEKNAWIGFKKVIKGFLENEKEKITRLLLEILGKKVCSYSPGI